MKIFSFSMAGGDWEDIQAEDEDEACEKYAEELKRFDSEFYLGYDGDVVQRDIRRGVIEIKEKE